MEKVSLRRILTLILLFSSEVFAQSKTDDLLKRLEEIAKSQDLELVDEEKFPVLNPYGSTGVPFVFGFMNPYERERGNSALFLTRRANEAYKIQETYGALDLIRMYDYFLVYAAEPRKGDGLEFVEILNTPTGLKGLFIYYGSAFDDITKYTYLNSNTPVEEVDWTQLSIPILISSESATTVLRNYNGKWIELTEVFD